MPDKQTEEAIMNALRSPDWDYRTVEGIAKRTGLSLNVVRDFLESHPELVWKSSIPDRRGRDLYTVQGQKAQSKEFWRKLSTFMSKTAN